MSDLRARKITLRALPKLAFLREKTKERPTAETAPVEFGEPIPAASDDPPVQPPIRLGLLGWSIINASGFGLFISSLYSAYSPASAGDRTATVAILGLGWIIAVGACAVSEALSSVTIRRRYLASAIVATFAAFICGAWGLTIFRPALSPVSKTGARLYFRIGGFTKASKKIEVTMLNLGDMVARAGVQAGSSYSLVNHIMSEDEEEVTYQSALKATPPLGKGIDVPINNGRTFDIDLNLTDAQYDSIIDGTMQLYFTVVEVFTDELAPSGKTYLASDCSRFNKKTDTAVVCTGHHEARLQN
jgi:hypothetical protein